MLSHTVTVISSFKVKYLHNLLDQFFAVWKKQVNKFKSANTSFNNFTKYRLHVVTCM